MFAHRHAAQIVTLRTHVHATYMYCRKTHALLDLPEFDPPIAGADSAFTCTHMYLEILRCNLEILQSEHRKVKKFLVALHVGGQIDWRIMFVFQIVNFYVKFVKDFACKLQYCMELKLIVKATR